MSINNNKLPTLTLALSAVIPTFSQAEIRQMNCQNTTQLSCLEQSYGIDKTSCPIYATSLYIDTQKISLQHNQNPDKTKTTDASLAWLTKANKHYSLCMALEDQPADSSSSWSNQLALGYMFQTGYNDKGENLGFKEQSAIAQIAFNGRWLYQDNTLLHWEIGGLFGKSAVNKQVKGDDSEAEKKPLTTPTFTDVDGSLDLYTKLTYTPTWAMAGNQTTLSSYFTVGALVGVKTRDVLTSEKDGVIGYAGLIGEFYYYGKNVRVTQNDIPRGRIMFGPVYFEEYGGADKELRWLFTGEWNITGGSNGDIVAGIKANMGKGSDDMGVFIAVRKPLSSLTDFFGFKG